MFTKTPLNKIIVIAAVALLVVSALGARATSLEDIVYPVAELGNCESHEECQAYCEQRGNAGIIRACLGFAKQHNLLPADVIARGEKFADVAAGGGPGGCREEKTCVAYCENIAHIQECVLFAEKYDLLPKDELAELQKIASALRAGAQLPGNCTGKENCVAYCENPAHIDECLAFAEKAGFMPPDELAEAKRVAPFLKRGETPGACKSKAECEAYCGNPEHVDECVSFAEKIGLMNTREAELIRRAGGKSPGDCARGARSAEEAQTSCAAFCNKAENHQACFRFAEEMGIMTAEEASQIGGLSDFQACYAVTPPRIRQCLDENLGQNILEQLLKGQMPLRLEELEEMMAQIREARACTNRYADQQLQTFTDDPDALACLDSELGAGFIDTIKSGNVACGDASVFQKKIASCMEEKISKKLDQCFALGCSEAKTCIQKLQGQSEDPIGEEHIDIDSSRRENMSAKLSACVAEDIRACLVKDCSEMLTCINRLQGEGGREGEEGGGLDSALEQEITAKVTACTEQQGLEGARPQQNTAPTADQQYQEQYRQQIQQYCPNFASAPSCSYVGSPDSENYKICKQCYPDR